MSGNPRWIYTERADRHRWVLRLQESLDKETDKPTTGRPPKQGAGSHDRLSHTKTLGTSDGGLLKGGVGQVTTNTLLLPQPSLLRVGAVGDSTQVDRRHRTSTVGTNR